MTLPEAIVEFIERVYRVTGEYPTEIRLPSAAFFPLCKWAKGICVFEESNVEKHTDSAIVLAQGTKIRLATR